MSKTCAFLQENDPGIKNKVLFFFLTSAGPGFKFFLFLLAMLGLFSLEAHQPNEPIFIKSGYLKAQDPSLEHLFFGAHPSVYIYEDQIETAGQGRPITLFCDAGSVRLLYTDYPEYQDIKLMHIKIESEEDLRLNLDLKKLDHFYGFEHISFVLTLKVVEMVVLTACQT